MDFKGNGASGYQMTQVQTGAPATAPDSMDCTTCGSACEKRISQSAKNPGREFWRCTGCRNFVGWTDGKSNYGGGGGGGGAKRKFGGGAGGGLGASVDALRERVAALEAKVAALQQ